MSRPAPHDFEYSKIGNSIERPFAYHRNDYFLYTDVIIILTVSRKEIGNKEQKKYVRQKIQKFFHDYLRICNELFIYVINVFLLRLLKF